MEENQWIDKRFTIPDEITMSQNANDIISFRLDRDLDLDLGSLSTSYVARDQVLIAAAMIFNLDDPLELVNLYKEFHT